MDILQTLAALLTLIAGGYFTARFRAFYLLHPIKTIRALPKNGVKQMLLSLGGTVGVGNIAGVAVAILLGGAGAVFWMWVGAFFAMALKYAEITLGMVDKKGACCYIKKALGSLAATLFFVMLLIDVVLMGGMIQSNAISEALHFAFSLKPLESGVIISLLAAFVFGFKFDLFRLSSYLVPIMSFGYLVFSFCVIVPNLKELPCVMSEIVKSAFCKNSAVGGTLGILSCPAVRQGIVKGLFSNEAGCGTAPTAHAASSEKVPAKQGLFGIFEVFVDTILMCTLTALVILLTLGENLSEIGGGGVEICARAFESVFGASAGSIVAAFVFLFAFCTVISFGYYGMQCFKNRKMQSAFLCIYCFFVLVGAVSAPLAVWHVADSVICVMLLVNTSAVLVFRKKVCDLHFDFYTHIGKYSESASKTASFCNESVKNAIPMSDMATKRGSMPKSSQNRAK